MLGFGSLANPIHRLTVYVLTSNAFTAVIITTILANTSVKGVSEDGGVDDQDCIEGFGGVHVDGHTMDRVKRGQEH